MQVPEENVIVSAIKKAEDEDALVVRFYEWSGKQGDVTLQLPPGGQPIALMAEHPTIGGYPRIGQVAAIDLSRLAQRRPGDSVRFAEIDLGAAQTRYLQRERELAHLIDQIAERLPR